MKSLKFNKLNFFTILNEQKNNINQLKNNLKKDKKFINKDKFILQNLKIDDLLESPDIFFTNINKL